METNNRVGNLALQSRVHAFVKAGSQDASALAADCRKLGYPVTDTQLAEIVSKIRSSLKSARLDSLTQLALDMLHQGVSVNITFAALSESRDARRMEITDDELHEIVRGADAAAALDIFSCRIDAGDWNPEIENWAFAKVDKFIRNGISEKADVGVTVE